MLRKVTRTLCLIDDVLEVVAWFVGRQLARRPLWTGLLVAALAGGAYWSGVPVPPTSPPPAPVPVVKAPPEIDPAVEAEMDRLLSGMMDSIEFKVLRTYNHGDHHLASIEYHGRTYEVKAGTVLPSKEQPGMVVTEVRCYEVTALDVANREMVTERQKNRIPRPVRFKVNAIAGDHPKYVAVVEYEGQTYIVVPGTKVPDRHTRFEVKAVTDKFVDVFDRQTLRIVRQQLLVDPLENSTSTPSVTQPQQPARQGQPVKNDDFGLGGDLDLDGL